MKKYLYKFQQNLKTSMDIGEITPIYWDTLYPGESIKNLSFLNLTRMITPIYPTLDNPKIELYAFAVPKRIIIAQNGTSKNPKEVTINTTTWSNTKLPIRDGDNIINQNAIVSESNLNKKFGISIDNITTQGFGKNFLLNYHLAYWKIYDQFFKQKQIELFNYDNFYRKLTINGTKAIIENPTQDQEKALRVINKIALTNANNDYLNELTFEPIKNDITGSWNDFKGFLSHNYIKNKMIIDKVNLGTIKDELISVWNTTNKDKTNPILLGYEEYEQTITQITNTAKTTTEALGEIGGMSVTKNHGQLIKNYTADEETIIMVLAVPNYKVSIATAFESGEWIGLNKTYNPEMEYIQEPRTKEFISSLIKNDTENETIGYVPPFNYLRHKKDVIAGEIMDNWSNWTYTEDLSKYGKGKPFDLGVFKVNKKPFKDTLVSPKQDSFIAEYMFNIEQLRTIKPLEIIEQEAITGE